jgi:hypothetical protein
MWYGVLFLLVGLIVTAIGAWMWRFTARTPSCSSREVLGGIAWTAIGVLIVAASIFYMTR